jgi:hypothetical protein
MKAIKSRAGKIFFAGVRYISLEKNIFPARAFTLVEVMIYIALFGMLVGGAVVSAYQVLSGGARNQRSIEIQEEGTFIHRKINWEVAQANTASVVSDTLVLEPGHVVFAEDAGRMTIARGASSVALPISSESVVLASTTFAVTPGVGGKPTSVRASFLVDDVPFAFVRYLRN